MTPSTSATSPAQSLGPLAFFSDSDLHWVKSPKPVFSEEEEASVRAGQCPVRPPRHASPVCQPAGVVVLWGHGPEVQHVVAGTLKDDHVTQGGIIEGAVGVGREPQLASLPGEPRIQRAASVAPHLLPCAGTKRTMSPVCLSAKAPFKQRRRVKGSTFEKIPFEVQRGEGGGLDGCGEASPALQEGQGTAHAPVSGHRPVHVGAEHKHRLILLWMQINGENGRIQVKPEDVFLNI